MCKFLVNMTLAKGEQVSHTLELPCGIKTGDTFEFSSGVVTKTAKVDHVAPAVQAKLPVVTAHEV